MADERDARAARDGRDQQAGKGGRGDVARTPEQVLTEDLYQF